MIAYHVIMFWLLKNIEPGHILFDQEMINEHQLRNSLHQHPFIHPFEKMPQKTFTQ